MKLILVSIVLFMSLSCATPADLKKVQEDALERDKVLAGAILELGEYCIGHEHPQKATK